MVWSRCYIPARGNDLSLYTVWDSLQDITMGLSLGMNCRPRVIPRTLLRSSGGDSEPDMSFGRYLFLFLLAFSIMAKKDMDLYHSRLTQDDLNDLIIKYKIPRDLHPRLPLEEFVTFELPDDAIGALSIFEIEPTRDILDSMVWRHPGAAIDDPRPAAGSFSMADVRRLRAHVIKLRDMPEEVLVLFGLSRVWKSCVCDLEEPHHDTRPTFQRLPFYCTLPAAADTVIPNPSPMNLTAGTPSAKVLAKAEASQKQKACTSGATSSHVPKRTRSALAQSFGSTTRPSLFVDNSNDESDDDDDACVEIPLVTPLRSAVVIPSSGNQGGSSVAPAAEGSNTRDSRGKGIMADDATAPSVGVSRPRPSFEPVPSFRDVSRDAIHADFFPFSAGPYYAIYPQDGVVRNCEFTREEWDAPYRPNFGVLTKEVFKDPAVYKTVVDQFPTPGEMVRVEALSEDKLSAKMSVLHCMMMSHGGELLSRYRGLLQSHHEYVLSLDSRLKGYEEKVASLTGLELQSKAKGNERKKKIKSLTKSLDNLHVEVAHLSAALNQATVLEAVKDEEILRLKITPLKFASFFCGQFQDSVWKFLAYDEFSRVQGELLSLAASAGFEHGLPLVAQTDYAFLNKILEHATEPLSVILQLKPEKVVRSANVPTSGDVLVSPPIVNELTVTPASKSLELSTNVVPASSTVSFEQNEERVNAVVDGSDLKMTDGAAPSKSGSVFVEGVSHILDDVVEVTAVGSERVSFGPTDVVVALSVSEKGDGLVPSSVAGKEAAANSFGV
ncbi:hypothetical protein Tco_1309458 [Tanacetum coccineum]